MIKVLVIEPKKKPVVKEIRGTLESMQSIVGGYIEVVYPFDDPVGIICNDEGKIIGLPLNRALYHDGEIYDAIAGTFIIAGLWGDDFCSLPDDLLDKYMDKFFMPEQFVKANGRVIAFPYWEGIFED